MTQFEIPDEANVVRLGMGTREQFDLNVQNSLKSKGFGLSAFSVLADSEMTHLEIADRHDKNRQFRRSTGKRLREVGLGSRKTGGKLHYSVLVPDGITDDIWGMIEMVFDEPESR